MVSGAVPEEVKVTDWAAELVFTVTLPKFRLVALSCNPGTYAARPIVKVWMVPPTEDVSVAVCAVVTAAMVAVNAALVVPADTVTDAGKVTAVSLLDKLTARSLLPAAVSVTVHVSLPEPVNELCVHDSELSVELPEVFDE